jgi:hypothetical protein
MTHRSEPSGPHLQRVVSALEASWDRDTAYATPEYLDVGRPGDRRRGQCGTTATVIHDWLGGEIIEAPMYVHGVEDGRLYWNRLPDGTEVDITRGQLLAHETIGPGAPVVRSPGPPRTGTAEYLLLSQRVRDFLVGVSDS